MPAKWETAPVVGHAATAPRWMQAPEVTAPVDEETGAPARVRAAVGAAQTPEDRLATIRTFYPDAEPQGENFIYTDPASGARTLYNPKGLQVNDFASLIPEAGEIVGGGYGAAKGAVGGAAVGSVAPVVGTGAGALVGGMAGAGLGAATGREAAITLADKLLPTVDTRDAGQRLGDATETAAWNAGGQLVGEALAQGVRSIYKHTLAPTISKEVFDQAAQSGATPTVGQTLGGAPAAVERGIAQMPFSGASIRQAGERQATAVGQSVQGMATGLAGGGALRTADEAGKILQEGGVEALEKLEKYKADLYQAIYPSNAPLVAKNSKALADTNAAAFAGNEAAQKLGNVPLWRQYQELTSKPLTIGDAKSLKTRLFKEYKRLVREGDNGQAADVYAFYKSFDEDIKLSADMALPGSGDALRAADAKASAAFRVQERLTRFLTGSPTKSADDPKAMRNAEALIQSFITKASSQGTADIETLRVLKRRLPSEAWGEVSGYMLAQIGLENAGKEGTERGFSPRTFLTNWKKTARPARDLLFREPLGPEKYQALERLVHLSDVLSRVPLNTSGTAAGMADVVALGSVSGFASGGDIGSTIIATFGPRLVAQGMASETLAKALNALPRQVLENPYKTAYRRQIIGAMLGAAGNEQELKQLEKEDKAKNTPNLSGY